MEEDIQEVHTLFKDFVRTSRPDMAIDKLATGETWLGSRARELGLVDETGTSDEYIVAACDNAEVYEVAYEKKKKMPHPCALCFFFNYGTFGNLMTNFI